eukprot:363862-Chlamydomonas_euryale.AAC.7
MACMRVASTSNRLQCHPITISPPLAAVVGIFWHVSIPSPRRPSIATGRGCAPAWRLSKAAWHSTLSPRRNVVPAVRAANVATTASAQERFVATRWAAGAACRTTFIATAWGAASIAAVPVQRGIVIGRAISPASIRAGRIPTMRGCKAAAAAAAVCSLPTATAIACPVVTVPTRWAAERSFTGRATNRRPKARRCIGSGRRRRAVLRTAQRVAARVRALVRAHRGNPLVTPGGCRTAARLLPAGRSGARGRLLHALPAVGTHAMQGSIVLAVVAGGPAALWVVRGCTRGRLLAHVKRHVAARFEVAAHALSCRRGHAVRCGPKVLARQPGVAKCNLARLRAARKRALAARVSRRARHDARLAPHQVALHRAAGVHAVRARRFRRTAQVLGKRVLAERGAARAPRLCFCLWRQDAGLAVRQVAGAVAAATVAVDDFDACRRRRLQALPRRRRALRACARRGVGHWCVPSIAQARLARLASMRLPRHACIGSRHKGLVGA